MIKLIACDMDGTLLTSDKQLPKIIGKVIDYLYQSQILFVIASGRQYDALKEVFSQDNDKLTYISDNGAFIHVNDQFYANDYLDDFDFNDITNLLWDYDVSIIFSGWRKAYVVSRNYLRHKEIIDQFYPNHTSSDNICFNDKIGKIAIMDKTGKLPVSDILGKFLHKYTITKSEERWFDIMKNDVNKGKAVRMLQELKEISYDETMVFGDMMNDYEMMQSGYYSYAMGNAVPEIKQISRYLTDTNDDQGVIKALQNYFNVEF